MPAPYKRLDQHTLRSQNNAKRQCRENEENSTTDESEQSDSDAEQNELPEQMEQAPRGYEPVPDQDEDELIHGQHEAAINVENRDEVSTISDRSDISSVIMLMQGESDDDENEEQLLNDVVSNATSDEEPDAIALDAVHDDTDEDDDAVGNLGQQGMDQPLYDGAPVTLAESMIATLDLSLRHNISGELLTDILKLTAMHCPPDNNCKTTLYKFNQYFSDLRIPVVRHFYCINCYTTVEQQDSVCPECREDSKISYFIEVPIKEQLEALFKRPGFAEMLRHRSTRERHNPANYEDIYDGAVYKELTEDGGFLENDFNISFTWYADGISIFRSSRYNIWPIYLVINELPCSERTKKENVVFAALWFGESKPLPNLLLQPLELSMDELREGIEVQVPNEHIPRNVKGLIICGTCDLPAKALFMNTKQYNGKFGCQKCKQQGEYLLDDHVMVYPYEPFDLRTDEETTQHAREAFESETTVCGVKGPTILSSIVHQYVRANAVDVMHCVFEGVVKMLLYFWFLGGFLDHPSSLHDFIDVVDERLVSLTPPSFVQRLCRSIKKHLKYWKAHELKAWFFYYSLPCLQDIMTEPYFNHYLLLVLGVSLLCQSSISPEDVNIAERALNEFVSRFEHLYGKKHMVNNVHQLLHLAECVRQFGPLWTTSCFPFEDLNGKLKRLVHGSNSAHLQIFTSVSKFLTLATLKSEKLVPGRPAHSFCENLNYSHGRMKRHRLMESVYIAGKYETLLELPRDISDIFQRSNIHGIRYYRYKKLLKEKMMFTATEYTRARRTNSAYALYIGQQDSKKIGKIRCFIRVTDCHCPRMCFCPAQDYAIVRPCSLENQFRTCIDDTILSTVHTVTDFEDNEVAVNISQLKSVCFCCIIQDIDETFVIEPVNSVEAE